MKIILHIMALVGSISVLFGLWEMIRYFYMPETASDGLFFIAGRILLGILLFVLAFWGLKKSRS